MPAKDTFGSQPPLELIRQWIDYGFWYDRQKQTPKFVKVSESTTVRHTNRQTCVSLIMFYMFYINVGRNKIYLQKVKNNLNFCPSLNATILATNRRVSFC